MAEIKGGRARVRVARVNCAECGGCGLLARDRDQVMEFTASARPGLEEGDVVILEVPSRRLVLSYLVIFGLPVLGMIAAYLAAMALTSLAGAGNGGIAVTAAVAAGCAFLWVGVKLAERAGFSPVIVRVLGRQGEDASSRMGGGAEGGGVL
ncbi:MAG: SoxR reducing system RseC family protein [Actinobacteria bacterium]|nr:SoxR reducing system RseC family protein [Actinomycetota bacterium]